MPSVSGHASRFQVHQKKFRSGALLLLLAAMIPVAVFAVNQRTNTRQKASLTDLVRNGSFDGGFRDASLTVPGTVCPSGPRSGLEQDDVAYVEEANPQVLGVSNYTPQSQCDTLRQYYCYIPDKYPTKRPDGTPVTLDVCPGYPQSQYYARTADTRTPCATGRICCKAPTAVQWPPNPDNPPADPNQTVQCQVGKIANQWNQLGQTTPYQYFDVKRGATVLNSSATNNYQLIIAREKGTGMKQTIYPTVGKSYAVTTKVVVLNGSVIVRLAENGTVIKQQTATTPNRLWNVTLDSFTAVSGKRYEVQIVSASTGLNKILVDDVGVTEIGAGAGTNPDLTLFDHDEGFQHGIKFTTSSNGTFDIGIKNNGSTQGLTNIQILTSYDRISRDMFQGRFNATGGSRKKIIENVPVEAGGTTTRDSSVGDAPTRGMYVCVNLVTSDIDSNNNTGCRQVPPEFNGDLEPYTNGGEGYNRGVKRISAKVFDLGVKNNSTIASGAGMQLVISPVELNMDTFDEGYANSGSVNLRAVTSTSVTANGHNANRVGITDTPSAGSWACMKILLEDQNLLNNVGCVRMSDLSALPDLEPYTNSSDGYNHGVKRLSAKEFSLGIKNNSAIASGSAVQFVISPAELNVDTFDSKYDEASSSRVKGSINIEAPASTHNANSIGITDAPPTNSWACMKIFLNDSNTDNNVGCTLLISE